MQENIDAVGGILGNLKSMAVTMGNEINSQDEQIDRIQSKQVAMDQGVNQVNAHAKSLL
jgi:hypothetical protein